MSEPSEHVGIADRMAASRRLREEAEEILAGLPTSVPLESPPDQVAIEGRPLDNRRLSAVLDSKCDARTAADLIVSGRLLGRAALLRAPVE